MLYAHAVAQLHALVHVHQGEGSVDLDSAA